MLILAIISQINIEPKFADRLFPYIKYGEAYRGTPFHSYKVAIPNVKILVSPDESPYIVLSTYKIAYFLGQWTKDFGSSGKQYMEKRFPNLVIFDRNTDYDGNLIVIGTKNNLFRKFIKKNASKPTIKVVKEGDRQIMFIYGPEDGILKAVDYISFVRLNFKVGAYEGFFNFVRLRGMIEKGYYDAALELIESPDYIKRCFKNLVIAGPMMKKMPEDFVKMAKKRNNLIFKELPPALKQGDKEKAIAIWEEAMTTCYYCHQEKKYRKYNPLPSIHLHHNDIALYYFNNCTVCHKGYTSIRSISNMGQ